MKRVFAILLALCFLPFSNAFAADISEETLHALIHEALLSDCTDYYKVEVWTEGHHILGMEKKDNTLRVYLAASVGGYGFYGGGFVDQSGWGGPCAVVLRQKNGKWAVQAFLEIEDYSEIPNIMPKKYENLFYALEEQDTTIAAQRTAQAQAYLDSIGRTEKIYTHPVDMKLPVRDSHIIAQAANLCMALTEKYPYDLTCAEYLMDGQRYLYTSEWEKAPGAPERASRMNEETGISHDFNGTYGTETFIKTLKDGTELERVTICADENETTVTCIDAYGRIEYRFPLAVADGFYQLHQPVIIRTGDCRMDTARFDLDWLELPGVAVSETVVEAQTPVSGTERFTLYRDGSFHTLALKRLTNEGWREVWRNAQLIPAVSAAVTMRVSPGMSLTETGRFARQQTDRLTLTAGEEHPAFYAEISRAGDGGWQVDAFGSRRLYCFAELTDDAVLFGRSDFSASQAANLSLVGVERNAAVFSAQTLDRQKYALYDALFDAPEGLSLFAGAEPMYLSPGIAETCPVYVCPDAASPRPANGKAAVSLNGWVMVLCRENGWLCVLYETGAGKYRMGWVEKSGAAALERAYAFAQDAVYLTGQKQALQKKAALIDDPVNGTGTLLTMKKGGMVSVLWQDDALEMAYVETEMQGKRWRGWVEAAALLP